MNDKGSVIPGFVGVVSSQSLEPVNGLNDVETILKTPKFQLFTYDNQKSNLKKYHVSDKYFLWTGGLGLEKDFKLDRFNNKKADHKFVCVKFSDSKLSIYTDHYSKIPLLYYFENETLYFSTSMELLLRIVGKEKKQTNLKGLMFYYNFGFTAFNHTLYDGVQSLSGGQKLTFNNGEIETEHYFNIFSIDNYNSNAIEKNIELIDKYLLESTQSTLSSSDNIGIALSGGVDSGYLAQKINEFGKTFNAYTIGFKDDYNEFERVDYLSDRLNFTTRKIILSPQEIISNYLEVSKNSSFPVGFNNSILNFIYKEASNDGVNIMFDGDGADRLFLGMNKYLQLKKILQFYALHKKLNTNSLFANLLKLVKHPIASKLRFYFTKFNNDFPFYGERKLPNSLIYDYEFESLLNEIALPLELKKLSDSTDKWLFFSFFSVYYTPTFFFHTPYELQLRHDIVSNPQFWSDDLVTLGLRIPVEQKLSRKTTKLVLREAAKLKIDDGYWNLSKIGLQNSYNYIKNSKEGRTFIDEQIKKVKQSDAFQLLQEKMPDKNIDTERLIPYTIWKEIN